ncbi:hypothetical protein ACF07Y_36960 [Streptomyces sp. NPDC016566]|uniref:hypothetical protein n=1 Tax=Streptomyces sp. NPDC016566 TaxID=3364967 RepID=UPI0036FD2614
MSKTIGSAIPTAVLDMLTAREGDGAEGPCIIVITVDPDGQPRPCLLSPGELLVVDEQRLRAVVWPGSRTTANLDRGAAVLITVAAPPDVFHLRAVAERLPNAPDSQLARFTFTTTSVERDGHEGLPVTVPMWFAATTEARQEVLAMWEEQQRALRH